jgi:hypothetical protein
MNAGADTITDTPSTKTKRETGGGGRILQVVKGGEKEAIKTQLCTLF